MIDINNPDVAKFLDQWLKGNRQFGKKRNHSPRSLSEYIDFIEMCKDEGLDAFVSINDTRAIIDKVFWDFDIHKDSDTIPEDPRYNSPEFDAIWRETLILNERIKSLGVKPLIVFSGSKGYHVWICTNLMKFNKGNAPRGKKLYKQIHLDILGDLEYYPHYDNHPKAVSGLARIPFSFHPITGRQVLPLTENREPYIPDYSEFDEKKLQNEFILDVWNTIPKNQNRYKINYSNKHWQIRTCLLEGMKVENPSHKVRLGFVTEAIVKGMSDEQIHTYFEGGSNYDYDKTQGFIEGQREYVADGGLPYNTKTLKDYKICRNCERQCKVLRAIPKAWGGKY
jgi:hypothetical protein